jgi:PAS domain S-box-containing protein
MPQPATPPKVFIVDDDVGLLRLIERSLQREGFATATASSGRDAIAWLTTNTADLMLLDLKLQDIEGNELISHLADVGRSVPFIIITGQGDERVAVEMMKRGSLDYLVKDVQFIEFVPTVVKRALAQMEKDTRLRSAEERAHLSLTLVEQGYSSVLVTSAQLPDPDIVYVNPAFTKLTGVAAHEVVGEPLSVLETRTGPCEDLRRALTSREAFAGEVTLRRADGELRITDCQIAPVLGEAGQLKHWAVIQRDVTRRKQLQREILEISESEQRRIGRDLHDGLGQHLTALELLSQALVGKLKTAAPKLVRPAQHITRQIRQTITQTRLLSHNLSPVPLEADGLMIALAELADGTQAISGIHCQFRCPRPVMLTDLNSATHLYRIAQEAVNNALKHSRAKRIRITLNERDNECKMAVEDDGRGLSASSRQSSGLGLRMMEYRAQLIGASLEIKSTPRSGVRIACTLRKGP